MSIGQIITSASITDKGNVRDANEDACLERTDAGLWVVADGMGGHHAGDVASQTIVDALDELDMGGLPGEILDRFDDTMDEVNHGLYALSLEGETPTLIGSTLASLIALPGHCIVAWVGDSRIYRLRDGRFEQLSRDHSQVEELIAQGSLTRAEAEAHPEANVITRAVGGEAELIVDMEIQPVQDNDRFLLCSDGLFKDLSEQEIAIHLGAGDCKAASRALIDEALKRECNDNVTVVIVDFAGRDHND